MAGKWAVTQQCSRLNAVRRVREAASYSFDRFWRENAGSFLITGGQTDTRTQALCDRLCLAAEMERGPVLVLTTSDNVEQEMIRRFQAGASGSVQICSRTYRNYHFFYGWSGEDVARFLIQAAELMGYRQERMPVYIHAFIDILSRCYQPGLAELKKLAGYTDNEIARIGRQCGASGTSADQVMRYAGEGEMFRLVLKQVSQNLLPLSGESCDSRFNLSVSSTCLPNRIYLVNMQSAFPALVHAYFAIELQLATGRAGGRSVVLSDIPLQENDPLRQFLKDAQEKDVELGFSVSNAGLALGEDNKVFPNRAVLLDAGCADWDLKTVLDPLGVYTHYEPMLSGGRPAELFAIMTDEHWQAVPEPNRPRVSPSDTVGFQAVLSGTGSPQILLARSLRRVR